MVLKGILMEPSQCRSIRVWKVFPLSRSSWRSEERVTITSWRLEESVKVSHLHHIIEKLIEDVDEDLVSDRLQTGGAVVSVWSTEIEGKQRIHVTWKLRKWHCWPGLEWFWFWTHFIKNPLNCPPNQHSSWDPWCLDKLLHWSELEETEHFQEK